PDVGTAGQYSIPLRVTDQGGLFDDGVLELEVQPNGPANLPPVLQNPGPQFLREGEPWSLQLQHTDPNPGQTHTYDYPVKPGAVAVRTPGRAARAGGRSRARRARGRCAAARGGAPGAGPRAPRAAVPPRGRAGVAARPAHRARPGRVVVRVLLAWVGGGERH